MRRIAIGNLQPGMVLGVNIFNARGDVMLKRGIPLSKRLITLLQQRGYLSVYVTEEEDADIDVASTLSERTQVRVTYKMRSIFESLQTAALNLRSTTMEALNAQIEAGALRQAVWQAFHSADLLQEINDLVDELMDANMVTGITSIKAHDTYMFQHAVDVMVIAVVLGKRIGLTPSQLRQLASGCLLHDIGKIFITPELLHRTGPLTTEEWGQMRHHPELGYRLLRNLGDWQIVPFHVAYQHHERQDGLGYPRGLKGLNTIQRTSDQERGHILLIAEICSVADAFDNLTSDLPYRPGLPPAEALDIIAHQAGTAFNREIVQELLRTIARYPVGSHVIIHNGSLNGYEAMVVYVPPGNPARPVVRLICNAMGNRVPPSEIELMHEPEISLSPLPFLKGPDRSIR
jgi:HD-GYP domain-containing protein (c-di-GMP phosphodiesterase class II)